MELVENRHTATQFLTAAAHALGQIAYTKSTPHIDVCLDTLDPRMRRLIYEGMRRLVWRQATLDAIRTYVDHNPSLGKQIINSPANTVQVALHSGDFMCIGIGVAPNPKRLISPTSDVICAITTVKYGYAEKVAFTYHSSGVRPRRIVMAPDTREAIAKTWSATDLWVQDARRGGPQYLRARSQDPTRLPTRRQA